MQCRVGDRIAVESERVGLSPRTGQVIEVLGTGDGLHYQVRWDDGHESTFYPSGGTLSIIPKAKRTANRA